MLRSQQTHRRLLSVADEGCRKKGGQLPHNCQKKKKLNIFMTSSTTKATPFPIVSSLTCLQKHFGFFPQTFFEEQVNEETIGNGVAFVVEDVLSISRESVINLKVACAILKFLKILIQPGRFYMKDPPKKKLESPFTSKEIKG